MAPVCLQVGGQRMADGNIGKKFGGYEILGEIGRGGMATVYRAQQISMNRIVALKVLPSHLLNDDTYIQRFEREVQIVSTLEHRSIVPVYDYGELEGQPYIVMRYMAGGSVDERLRSGPLNIESILAIYEQIGPGLDYAHSKGILHRDLKPSNVLMDESGGAFLTDFGIARLLSEGAGTITTHGVVGTPSYMSPEQAQGKPLDNRSDVYSLGVMLFELSTGRRPFEADTPYGIAVAHVTEPPPAPRSIRPEISPALESVILTAMSKNREQRYPDSAALVDAIRQAARQPDSLLFDTQPGTSRSLLLDEEATIPMPPTPPPPVLGTPISTPPEQQPVYPTPIYNTPPSAPPMPAVSYTNASGQIPPVRQRRRANGLWMSAMLGAMIGCGMFAFVALVVVLILSVTSDNNQPTPTATSSSQNETIPPTNTRQPTQRPLVNTNTPLPTPNPDATLPVGIRTLEPLIVGGENPQGQLIFYADRDGNFDIFTVDLETREERQLTENPAADVSPVVSPDGSTIVFASNRDGDFELYAMDADGSNLRALTSNSVDDISPSFSPGGTWIVYASDTRGNGTHEIYRMYPNGTNTERVYRSEDRNLDPWWRAEDNALYFASGNPTDASTWDIRRIDFDTGDISWLTRNNVRDRSPTPGRDGTLLYETDGDGHSALALINPAGGESVSLYDSPGFDWAATLSLDGRFIVFTSNQSGRDELYIMTAAGTDAQQITTQGGMGASWIPEI